MTELQDAVRRGVRHLGRELRGRGQVLTTAVMKVLRDAAPAAAAAAAAAAVEARAVHATFRCGDPTWLTRLADHFASHLGRALRVNFAA